MSAHKEPKRPWEVYYVTPCCGWSMYAADAEYYICKNCSEAWLFNDLIVGGYN